MKNNGVITPLSLRLNFLWTLIGNAAYAGSKWLVLIILAKLGSAEMVGQFALGVAVSMPIMAFTDLQLQTVMVTDVSRTYNFGDYLGLRILTTSLAMLVILGIVIVLGYDLENALVVLLVTLERAVVSISSIFHGFFQQHDRMDFISTSSFLRSTLSLVGISLMAILTGSIVWICLGMAVGSAAVSCLYDLPKGWLFARISQMGCPGGSDGADAGIILRPRWTYDNLKKLTWSALPLGLIFAVMALNYNIPRYFIERNLGVRELGIFAALYAPAAAGRFILTALGNAASRRLANYYALKNKTHFVGLLVKLAGIGILVGAGGIAVAVLAGKQLLHILYKPEFAEYSGIFLWLMGATAISYIGIFLAYGLTSTGRFWLQTPLIILSIIVSIMACYFLVARYGLLGAAFSEVIVQIVGVIGNLLLIFWVIRYYPRNI